jgi:hypothetical protein
MIKLLLEEVVVTVPPEIRPKVANTLRRLLSNHDGELLAAVYALKRIVDIMRSRSTSRTRSLKIS